MPPQATKESPHAPDVRDRASTAFEVTISVFVTAQILGEIDFFDMLARKKQKKKIEVSSLFETFGQSCSDDCISHSANSLV